MQVQFLIGGCADEPLTTFSVSLSLATCQQPRGLVSLGEEAVAKARREDKPIFLSIGYAACHWCHVMAHESFENEQIAAYLTLTSFPSK